nr:MAG TPA: hypothetical protein [Caudoviricetes sp.]
MFRWTPRMAYSGRCASSYKRQQALCHDGR